MSGMPFIDIETSEPDKSIASNPDSSTARAEEQS